MSETLRAWPVSYFRKGTATVVLRLNVEDPEGNAFETEMELPISLTKKEADLTIVQELARRFGSKVELERYLERRISGKQPYVVESLDAAGNEAASDRQQSESDHQTGAEE